MQYPDVYTSKRMHKHWIDWSAGVAAQCAMLILGSAGKHSAQAEQVKSPLPLGGLGLVVGYDSRYALLVWRRASTRWTHLDFVKRLEANLATEGLPLEPEDTCACLTGGPHVAGVGSGALPQPVCTFTGRWPRCDQGGPDGPGREAEGISKRPRPSSPAAMTSTMRRAIAV